MSSSRALSRSSGPSPSRGWLTNTILLFAIRTWLMPYFKRMAEERNHAERQLRERLGRDPTEEEVLAHFGITRTR